MTKDEARVAKRQVSTAKLYADVFGSPEGRLVLIDLMKRADFISTAPSTEFENGKRALVAEILRQFRMDHAKLLKLLEERVAENDE